MIMIIIIFIISLLCTLLSHLCAHHDDTSTHVDCSALFKTDYKESSRTCPPTLQLHITLHCVERVSKLGWWRSLVADDGQWERALSFSLSWCLSLSSPSMESLQEQLMDLAAKNIELTQRLATVEAASSAIPTPQQVLLPSVIDTSLIKHPVVFDGDKTKWADWVFTFRAYASAVSTRMVVVMEHAQSATEPWDLPAAASVNQANAQLRYVLVVLVKDGAMKQAGNAPVGHGREIWRLKCEEYDTHQRRRFQAMLSAILKVQLREPLGESACLRRPLWETHSG